MVQRLVKYESDFIARCKKLKMTPSTDTDGSPVVRAKGKRLKKILAMCPFQKEKFAVVIMAPAAKTKNKLINRLKDLNIDASVYVEGDTEAIVLIPNDEMSKVIRPMKFVRTRNLTAEQRVEIRDRLAKAREAKKAS